VETTAFNKKISSIKPGLWFKYLRNIVQKKRYVEDILGKKFKFVLVRLNLKQIQKVRLNMLQQNS